MKKALFFAVGLAVVLSFCLGQESNTTQIVGGRGGSAFADSGVPPDARVLEIQVRAGDAVDSVQMLYLLSDGRTTPGQQHGGMGGQLNTFRLDNDEYLVGISGRYGNYLDSIKFQTNKRTSPVYGGRGGSRDFSLTVPAGYQAVGFAGRSGNYIDAIGLIYAPVPIQISQTAIAGGRGGSSFSDKDIPRGARISEVRVRSGRNIDGIQAIYLLPDGRTSEGPFHGGRGGSSNSFVLDSDEYIVGVSGRYGDYMDSLQIHTNKRSSPVYGGSGGNRDFRLDVPGSNQVIGFSGRSGNYLDAIGLNYTPATQSRDYQRRWPGRNSDQR
jgi:hypothetical protein